MSRSAKGEGVDGRHTSGNVTMYRGSQNRSGMHRLTQVVMLACGHQITFPEPAPMKGEEVYCFRCTDMKRVTAAPEEWRVVCMDCPYSRAFGILRLSAEMAATRHAQRKRDHVIHVKNGLDVWVTLGDPEARAKRIAGTRALLEQRYREQRGETGTLFPIESVRPAREPARGTEQYGEPPY